MQSLSTAEENYLKTIYRIAEQVTGQVSTNAIAGVLLTTPASVTDMVQRLSKKKLVHYEKYRGVSLTEEGIHTAIYLIRKHRLWEVFLADKLKFTWDEVHDIAEQLEHIHSVELISRLDAFLGFPKFDPHGDAIPDELGKTSSRPQILLNELPLHHKATVVGVNEHSSDFLQYLTKINIGVGTIIEILEYFTYDHSIKVALNGATQVLLSGKVSTNLFVHPHPNTLYPL
jgi:DtxR family Mn-dependent transcriptional regulator